MSDPTARFTRAYASSGVVFTDGEGKVLLVHPSYKDYFDLPGGYIDIGESPTQAARRELREELGIEPPIGAALVAHWWDDHPEGGLGPKILFVFDGGTVDETFIESITVDGREILDFSFVAPDDLDQVTIPRLAARIRSALTQRGKAGIDFRENGQ